MAKNKLICPFVKWVGGKRQLLDSIMEFIPQNIHYYTYAEPFIGGGAVFFHIQPKNAIINDLNSELMNVYTVVKENSEELVTDLKRHKNEPEYFYAIRQLDRSKDFKKIDKVQRASRLIYLNKTCYNGLYRVNKAGKFNSPFGRYKNPNIVNKPVLKAVSTYLNRNNVQIANTDYEEILKTLDKNSFVYLDPPYHPVSESANFTGYVQGGWNIFEQIRLREACDELTSRGIKFLLSNSASGFIKDLYRKYHITTVKAIRSINANAKKRGETDEVLIRNYE
ncbi:MAG: DNA adenine methylase [Dysgonamonadaceae bacterium]|nr:DNA adenine methylase [Dysgonamonadaceae bacterium]